MKLGLSFEIKGVNYRTTCYGDKPALANIIQSVQSSNALITYCNMVIDKPTEDKKEETEQADIPFES